MGGSATRRHDIRLKLHHFQNTKDWLSLGFIFKQIVLVLFFHFYFLFLRCVWGRDHYYKEFFGQPTERRKKNILHYLKFFLLRYRAPNKHIIRDILGKLKRL